MLTIAPVVRFRPNVAALFVRPEGQLLVCERSTFQGAWQFPQGGVDPGESLEQALAREVQEEIGLLPDHYEVLRPATGYRYIYPPDVRVKKQKKHGYHGQEQTYYLCRLKPNAPEVNINQKPKEFSAVRWIEPTEFDLEWLPEFKREVYRQVMKDFFDLSL
jgi:putative (di)nucleoside polyphosphate hydrolase